MKPTFYPRLAWMGIKKNARLYVPYLLSCAFMAAMLYVIAYLAVTPALYTVNGKVNGSGTSAVAMTMSLGSFVVSVFIALFLFYTNSFLLRRRKKEFGLYSVLGMDRGALSAILFWETLLAAAFTLIAGLGLGLLLSYVSQSALLRLLSLPAAAFTVSLAAIRQCAITFIAIFALLYVRGVLSLRHAQGAALLKSEKSVQADNAQFSASYFTVNEQISYRKVSLIVRSTGTKIRGIFGRTKCLIKIILTVPAI